MKFKQFSSSMKFMLVSIVAIIISIATLGLTHVFAEPTIEEMVTEDMILNLGEFQPNVLYDDEEAEKNAEEGKDIKLVGMLNVTDLFFSYDYWTDYNEDGQIDLEYDIYDREGYEDNMFMFTELVPILHVNESDNYYIVPFEDYDLYNSVVVDCVLGKNNDKAQLKEKNTYWFDAENGLLYLDKKLIGNSPEKEEFNTLRVQFTSVTKKAVTLTRDVEVITLFDKSIEDTKGMYNKTPNKKMRINVMDWYYNDLSYKLVKQEHLAFVKAENLTVYMNTIQLEDDQWHYNPLTGVIYIDCPVSQTRSIVVKFNKLEDPTFEEQAIQALQSLRKDNVGQAATFEGTLKASYFLDLMQYDAYEPQVGANEPAEFTSLVKVNRKNESITINNAMNGTITAVPKDQLAAAMSSYVSKANDYDYYLQAATLSAWQTGDVNSSSDWNARQPFRVAYGDFIYSLYLAQTYSSDSKTYINAALNKYENLFCANVFTGTGYPIGDYYLSSNWRLSSESQLYVTGKWTSNSFLGGQISGGKAFFELTCACIQAPHNDAYNAMGSTNTNDFVGDMTIVKVVPDNTNKTTGNMVVAIWSDNLASQSKKHTQRLLGFSKIPYKYNGTGKVQIMKRDSGTNAPIPGAVYTIYASDGITAVTTITTSNNPVTSCDLVAGTYYVKETTYPTGYLADPEAHKITISGGQVRSLDLHDDPQLCEFELVVYDKTTKDNSVKVPVNGISFDLMRPDGTLYRSYTTGYDVNGNKSTNGVIKDTVPAIGVYTLVQDGTVKNYAMDTLSTSPDYCRIQIDATPNQSGSNIIYTGAYRKVHYENRQAVIIKSQVQDAKMKEATPYELGGDKNSKVHGEEMNASSYVTTGGAVYQLVNKTELLLGYTDNGTEITIPKDTVLTLETYDKSGSLITSKKAYSHDVGGKGIIQVNRIAYGTGANMKYYGVPNGKYEWQLLTTSSGYYNDQKVTPLDAEWDAKNKDKIDWTVNNVALVQTRQTVDLTLFVKSYTDNTRNADINTNQISVILDKQYGRIKGLAERLNSDVSSEDYLNYTISALYKKKITSNQNELSKDSTEVAVLYNESGDTMLVVETNGNTKNAIYQLSNINPIVDVDTGQQIDAGTVLGMFISDGDGLISIEQVGSIGFDNPNKTTKDSLPRIKDVNPMTINKTIATGQLPNGSYALTLISPPDDHEKELGMEESIIFNTGWNVNDSKLQHLERKSISILYDKTVDPILANHVYVAPDVPVQDPNKSTPENPYDPYDPTHPDDPANIDDSNDITIVGTKWIDENNRGVNYRIIDSENITGGAGSLNFDVSDTLPTTFAFYLKDPNIYDENYNYTYRLSFYYEITKSEYDAAAPSAKASNEYIMTEGVYFRRFKSNSLSGGENLQDVIVLNKMSPGYDNYTTLRNKEKTVSGAIYNTSWLNEQLAKQEDGDFKIALYIDTEIVFKSKFGSFDVTIIPQQRRYGILTMKNRELIRLD